MFHPLLPDLSKLKNEDLDNKIVELSRNYFIAARSGMGGACNQINVLLECYKQEQARRHEIDKTKLREKNKDLDTFINVDR